MMSSITSKQYAEYVHELQVFNDAYKFGVGGKLVNLGIDIFNHQNGYDTWGITFFGKNEHQVIAACIPESKLMIMAMAAMMDYISEYLWLRSEDVPMGLVGAIITPYDFRLNLPDDFSQYVVYLPQGSLKLKHYQV